MTMTPTERAMRAQIAAHTRWAHTGDRTQATAPARNGLRAKYERQADPDGTLPPEERARRTDHLLQAHYARMRLAKAKARRVRTGGPTDTNE